MGYQTKAVLQPEALLSLPWRDRILVGGAVLRAVYEAAPPAGVELAHRERHLAAGPTMENVESDPPFSVYGFEDVEGGQDQRVRARCLWCLGRRARGGRMPFVVGNSDELGPERGPVAELAVDVAERLLARAFEPSSASGGHAVAPSAWGGEGVGGVRSAAPITCTATQDRHCVHGGHCRGPCVAGRSARDGIGPLRVRPLGIRERTATRATCQGE